MASVVGVGAATSPAAALRLAGRGHVMLWAGDYHAAKGLLAAMGAQLAASPLLRPREGCSAREAFLGVRAAAAERQRLLGALHVPVSADGGVALPRAPPSLAAACIAAGLLGAPALATSVPLREVLGAVGAYEWRRRGVRVPALGHTAVVRPHFGVWSPVRQEHVHLVAAEQFAGRSGPRGRPLPPRVAWDVGTGTGVLACVLAARGVRGVLATDIEPRAVECARENAAALGFAGAITVEEADLFPHAASRTAAPASLIVCNPPWMPCTPAGIVHNGSSIGVGAALDRAVFDPAGAVLSRLLAGLGSALAPGGESEAWLLLSDLPERVGLRARGELLDAIARAGLAVRGRRDAPARSSAGPLARGNVREPAVLRAARAAEVVSLWRLGI